MRRVAVARRAGPALAMVVVVAVTLGATVTGAAATGIGGLSLDPSGPTGPGSRAYFAYQLQPGARLQDTVAVTNSTDKPLTFRLYARDAFSASTAAGDGQGQGQGQGGIAYQQESDEPHGAGAWITLPVDHYTLQGGTRLDIAFTVAVPSDAPAGDHVAGIVAALVPDGQTADTASGLLVEQRLAARVYVRVEGDLQPALAVSSLDLHYDRGVLALPTSAGASVDYTVDNTGDVRLNPDVTFTLEDLAGRRVARSPTIRLTELLPGGRVSGSYSFGPVLGLTRLRVRMDVVSVGVVSASAHRSASKWVVPWPVVGVLAIVLATSVVVTIRRRRRSLTRGSR